MRYGVTRFSRHPDEFVELTLRQYNDALAAREAQLIVLSIEEKLNLLLENYVDLEVELLNITTRRLVFQHADWSSSIGDLHIINRRLANLLTATRLYVDQVSHDISKLYGKTSETFTLLKQEFSKQYDTKFGYRALEAIRNHAQHHGLPVHHLRTTQEKDPASNRGDCRIIVRPSVSVEQLKTNDGFKKSILKELEAYIPPNSFGIFR